MDTEKKCDVLTYRLRAVRRKKLKLFITRLDGPMTLGEKREVP